MDALEFLRERKRMCKSFGTACDGCPLHGVPCTSISSMNDADLERILFKVEQWSKEHPRKTRQSVFLEQWPDGMARLRELAEADKGGRLVVLPCNEVLTNADRMRTATNQQLAKQIYDTQKEFCSMLYKKLGFEDELNFSEDYSDILAWLNAPSKEAEKALEAMEDD